MNKITLHKETKPFYFINIDCPIYYRTLQEAKKGSENIREEIRPLGEEAVKRCAQIFKIEPVNVMDESSEC